MSAPHGRSRVAPMDGRPLVAPMRARSPDEPHRASTPLELLFDLVFVVAISQAAAALHHAIITGHVIDGLLGYAMVFFAIWWAWMNFTWFASAYDCDDVPYRLTVFVQMSGALMLAAGVPAMFDTRLPNIATVGGYVVMRLASVSMWLRAARANPEHRTTARRYAGAISALQTCWVGLLFLPSGFVLPAFLVFASAELLVPLWAEHAKPTTWHPQHIAERYGLLTLIVLGESILSANVAIRSALASGSPMTDLLPIIVGGLLIVYSMWWFYFDRPVHDLLTSLGKAVVWGYGHYFVFAAAAAVGAGLGVSIDQAMHQTAIGSRAAGAAVTVPVTIYVLCLWLLHDRPEYRQTRAIGPSAAIFVLLTLLTHHAVLWTGVILASLVALKLFLRWRASR